MIDFLRGKLVYREAEYIVIDVQGVGYRLFCANPFTIIHEEDKEVLLYTHYHVREDAVVVYGFQLREEQALFRKLLFVTGIGPRVALGILSVGRPEAVVSAIYQEDIDFLIKLPGIGRKTAQRIILDLKDKLADLPMLQAVPASGAAGGKAAAGLMRLSGVAWNEAKLALTGLGFSEAEIDRVAPSLQVKVSEGAAVDVLIKLALQALMKL